jgi:ATP-binding protein involved in chromosome partitioning
MPPGTGDVALSLSQTVPAAGAIVVTTPQQVSLADTRRAVRMYQKLNIPTLGLVENMSFYECPNCHHEAHIFGHGGGEQVAQQLNVPFLGRLPLYEPIRVGSDRGISARDREPESRRARVHGCRRSGDGATRRRRAQGGGRQQGQDPAHTGQVT